MLTRKYPLRWDPTRHIVELSLHLARSEDTVIALGVILLIIGFLADIAILWTIGIVLLVIGAALWILGAAGHAVGGRRHYW